MCLCRNPDRTTQAFVRENLEMGQNQVLGLWINLESSMQVRLPKDHIYREWRIGKRIELWESPMFRAIGKKESAKVEDKVSLGWDGVSRKKQGGKPQYLKTQTLEWNHLASNPETNAYRLGTPNKIRNFSILPFPLWKMEKTTAHHKVVLIESTWHSVLFIIKHSKTVSHD